MLDFLLSGEIPRFWLHNYLTIPATAIAIILALVVYKRAGKSAGGTVIKGVSITSAVATIPLTFHQVGLAMAISNIDAVIFCSIGGAVVSLMLGVPFIFVKDVSNIRYQTNAKINQVKRFNTDSGRVSREESDMSNKPDSDKSHEEKSDLADREDKTVRFDIDGYSNHQNATNMNLGIITIGRAPDNDIVLDKDAKVSRHHARLVPKDDGYILEDTGSLNGTKVNGVRVSSEKIEPTSVIRLGETEILGSKLLGNGVNSDSPNLSSHNAIDDKAQINKIESVGTIDRVLPKTSSAMLTFKNGTKQGDSLSLDKEFTCIGRSAENDIQLTESRVSRKHALIKKINEKYAIFDSGSTSGTFINGEQVSGVRVYGDVGTIKVGETELGLITFENQQLEDESGYSDNTYNPTSDVSHSSSMLIIKKGPGSGSTFPISEGVNYIGRGEENHVNLSDSVVSRRHCAIVRRNDTYEVFELGSRSGTIVNEKVVQGKFLKTQDVIKIGKTECIFTHFNLG
tara:strand:+ start:1055 stop:2590 length:1536 start_codon:yes stop_codon:yes gene_type:complete